MEAQGHKKTDRAGTRDCKVQITRNQPETAQAVNECHDMDDLRWTMVVSVDVDPFRRGGH